MCECGDTGGIIIEVDDLGLLTTRYCTCFTAKVASARIARAFGDTEVGKRFENLTLETFWALTPDQRAGKEYAAEKAQEMIEGQVWNNEVQRPGIVFWGDPGTCKTGLACPILTGRALRGESTLLLGWSEFVGKVKETFSESSAATTEELIRVASDTDVVLFDDMGATAVTPYQVDLLYRVISKRHARMLPTAITLNLTPAQFRQRFTNSFTGLAPTVDRIDQMCHWIKLGGKNLREESEL